jgi:hypothetical protein
MGPLGAGLRGEANGGGAVTAGTIEGAGRWGCALITGEGSGAALCATFEALEATGAAPGREPRLPQLRERAYWRIASFTR